MANYDGHVKIGTELDSSGLQKGLSGLGNFAKSGLSVVTSAIGAVSAGLTALGGYAISVGSDFEAACSQIAATMGVTTADIGDLIDKASELGRTTSFSATEAAEGLNILAMSGLEAEEQIAAIGDVLNLAAAGSLSLESAASYTTGTIKGFADSMSNAQYYTDMIAKGATLANTDVNALGAALSSAAATANSYGQQADSVTLSLLRLAEQNVTGAEASTALNRAMMDLYTPTDAAQKALERLGVSCYTSEGKARDFNIIVDELNGALADMSDEEANATKNAIFTTYGLQAFNKMTVSSTQTVQKFKDGLSSASDGIGSAAEQAETMLNNLQGQVTILKSTAEGFGIAVYKEMQQPLTDLARYGQQALTKLTEAFTEGGVDGLIEAGGEILSNLALGVAEAIPGLINMAVDVINSFLSAVDENTFSFFRAGSKILGSLLDGMIGIIPNLLDVVELFLIAFDEYFPLLVDKAQEVLTDLLLSIREKANDWVGTGANLLLSFASGIKKMAPTLIPLAIDAALSFAEKILDCLPDLLDAGISIIVALAEGVINALPQLIERIPKIINDFCATLDTLLPKIITAGIQIIGSLATGIISNLPLILENAGQIVMAIANVILHLDLLSVGKNLIQNLGNGVKSMATAIAQAAKELFNTLLHPFSDTAAFTEIGKNLMNGLVSGVKSMASSLASAAKNSVSSAITAAKNFLQIRSPSRLTRDLLGKNMIAGINTGIKDETPNLEKTSADSMESAVESMQAVSYRNAGKAAESYAERSLPRYDEMPDDDSSGRVYRIEVPVTIDAREVARATAEYTDEQIAWEVL